MDEELQARIQREITKLRATFDAATRQLASIASRDVRLDRLAA